MSYFFLTSKPGGRNICITLGSFSILEFTVSVTTCRFWDLARATAPNRTAIEIIEPRIIYLRIIIYQAKIIDRPVEKNPILAIIRWPILKLCNDIRVGTRALRLNLYSGLLVIA